MSEPNLVKPRNGHVRGVARLFERHGIEGGIRRPNKPPERRVTERTTETELKEKPSESRLHVYTCGGSRWGVRQDEIYLDGARRRRLRLLEMPGRAPRRRICLLAHRQILSHVVFLP